MSRHTGHIELDRTVDSIIVGNRHRTDLGDLTALAESIARDGLLQPLTVTIDGVLVCGARRLAAIKLLGWRTVSVWVRSGISGRLGHLLAEQDDNMLHKDLTPVEAAALYRELKTLMAEDASRRQAATRFSADNQPGKDGAGNFPAPSEAVGRASEQAAAMIPGGASYKTLDKIDYLRQVTDDPDLPATVRGDAAAELERIDAGFEVLSDLAERVQHTFFAFHGVLQRNEFHSEKVAPVKVTPDGVRPIPVRTPSDMHEWPHIEDLSVLVHDLDQGIVSVRQRGNVACRIGHRGTS